MHDEGRFSITVRLLLTETQRERLLALCQQQHADVADVLTEIVGQHLDRREDLTVAAVGAPPTSPAERDALHRHVRQLRMQASRLGPETPPWLRHYIAELEQEIAGKQ